MNLERLIILAVLLMIGCGVIGYQLGTIDGDTRATNVCSVKLRHISQSLERLRHAP